MQTNKLPQAESLDKILQTGTYFVAGKYIVMATGTPNRYPDVVQAFTNGNQILVIEGDRPVGVAVIAGGRRYWADYSALRDTTTGDVPTMREVSGDGPFLPPTKAALAPDVDLTGLVDLEPVSSEVETRQKLIAEVMAAHSVVAKAFSVIDSPFAAEDAIHEHARLEHELVNLVGRVVCLPGSVEGLQMLERWYETRTKAMADIGKGLQAGVAIQLQDQEGVKATPLILNKDMATGMRTGMAIALQVLGKYPLTLQSDDGED